MLFIGLINWADELSGNKDSSENPTEDNTDKAALNELLEEGEEVVELGNEQSVHSVDYTWHQPKLEASEHQGKLSLMKLDTWLILYKV